MTLNRSQSTSYQKGLQAEARAEKHLIFQHYHIIANRYKTPHGEIDIICTKDQTLIAVEVKNRKSMQAGLESIRSKQKERIQNALHFFISHHSKYENFDCRFDVIILTPTAIRHLPHAWIEEGEGA